LDVFILKAFESLAQFENKFYFQIARRVILYVSRPTARFLASGMYFVMRSSEDGHDREAQ